MLSEKNFSFRPEQKKEPKIIIKKSSEAPSDVKDNPFYDTEFLGHAFSPDDIYLPDSDEALSFPMAAHEIGHLVKEGERLDASLDNFKATRAEEQRAWDKGWGCLQSGLEEYYQNNPEVIPKIQQSFERIKNLQMQAVDLSKSMYLERGALDNLTVEEKKSILKEQQEKLLSEKGKEFKNIYAKVKEEKIGQKPNWDRFTKIVTKAVKAILNDNKQFE